MRIASYNIQCGGFSDYSTDEKKPPRIEKIKKAVKDINADIFILIDTHKWIDTYNEKQLAKMFGYKGAYMVDLEDKRLQKMGHNNGIVALSNVSNTKYECVSLGTRNCLKVVTQKLDIFGVYLDDQQENTRKNQVDTLLTSATKNKNTILIGDFNCISRLDKSYSEKKIAEYELKYPKLFLRYKNTLLQMLKGEALDMLYESGFCDSGKDCGATIPSHLFPVYIDKPFLRIDYIFTSPSVEIKNIQVPKGTIYDKTSDHYPLLADIL